MFSLSKSLLHYRYLTLAASIHQFQLIIIHLTMTGSLKLLTPTYTSSFLLHHQHHNKPNTYCFNANLLSLNKNLFPPPPLSVNGGKVNNVSPPPKLLTLPTILTIGRVAAVPLLVTSADFLPFSFNFFSPKPLGTPPPLLQSTTETKQKLPNLIHYLSSPASPSTTGTSRTTTGSKRSHHLHYLGQLHKLFKIKKGTRRSRSDLLKRKRTKAKEIKRKQNNKKLEKSKVGAFCSNPEEPDRSRSSVGGVRVFR